MKRTGRQSNNVEDIRDPKANANYQGVQQQRAKAVSSPRLFSDEAVAYNEDKSPSDRVANIIRNPGKKGMGAAFKNEGIKDPKPDSIDKTSRANYDEVPFFKHKEVSNVYKEEK